MDIQVVYHSKTGNTKKLAEIIAGTLQVKAVPIGNAVTSLSQPADLLFIGDGVYFGKMHKETMAFLSQLSPAAVKNVAVF